MHPVSISENVTIESGSQLRTLIEHSSDIITVVDEEGVVQYESPSIERILGYDPDELVGQNTFEHIHPDDRPHVVETFEKLIGSPGLVTDRAEFRYRHKDGSWVWLESTATNRTDTQLDGYVITSRSIEERKEFEQALEEKNEQLEALNRIVRHDIRNDMAIILGWSEALEDNIGPEGEDDLRKIQDSGAHILELTKSAREFVETLGSDGSPEVGPTSVRSILSTEIEIAREYYPDAEFETDSEIPDVDVRANELLGSVFRNILNNAIQHTDEDTPIVTLDWVVGTEVVEIRVADNGPGIPDEQKTSVFGKGDKGLDSPGTGIGLYLVQELVDQYDGRVWVEDTDPDGSIFVVQLPIAN